jgi:glycine dehydrogenase subunit 2
MLSVADEAESDPDKVRDAPHETVLARLDETKAARFPVLTWRPSVVGQGS